MSDIFSDQGSQIDPNKDYASELIGEGKRYADVKVAAKALVDKDEFIKQLQKETAEMRAQLKGEAKLDELLDKLKNVQAAPATTTNTDGHQPQERVLENKPTLSLEDVQKLLEERERKATEQTNLNTATQKVREVYGANAGLVIEEKAAALGMSKDQLANIARTNPQAFLKLVEADKAPSTVNAPRTQVNTAAFKDSNGNLKNNKYYAELRKKLGADFWKPAVQNEMMRAAKEMGEKFYE